MTPRAFRAKNVRRPALLRAAAFLFPGREDIEAEAKAEASRFFLLKTRWLLSLFLLFFIPVLAESLTPEPFAENFPARMLRAMARISPVLFLLGRGYRLCILLFLCGTPLLVLYASVPWPFYVFLILVFLLLLKALRVETAAARLAPVPFGKSFMRFLRDAAVFVLLCLSVLLLEGLSSGRQEEKILTPPKEITGFISFELVSRTMIIRECGKHGASMSNYEDAFNGANISWYERTEDWFKRSPESLASLYQELLSSDELQEAAAGLFRTWTARYKKSRPELCRFLNEPKTLENLTSVLTYEPPEAHQEQP